MRKKIICMFVCMLMIATVFPVVKSVNNSEIPLFVANKCGQPCTRENWTEIQKLLASDGVEEDSFGFSVSIDGNTVLIGAAWDDDNGNYSGSAYVFICSDSTWTQQAKLLAEDGVEGDYFGCCVSLDGNTALIGSFRDDKNGIDSGSAYVFTRSGSAWTQQTQLLASDGAAEDLLGFSVSLDVDTAIIGAPQDDDNGMDSGSAYVFIRSGSTWTQQQKLYSSDSAEEDFFGVSISLDGDTALIGVQDDDDNGPQSGSAYIFTRTNNTWKQQAKLLALDGATLDFFGGSVSLDGDTALIGAIGDDDNGDWSGSAYVFTRIGTTWIQDAKLLAFDGAEEDFFGVSVSLDDDIALIGAPQDDDTGNGSGSAYVFIHSCSTWTQQQKLLASDGTADDWFGGSVDLDGGIALIGADWDDDNGVNSGSVYVFKNYEQPNQPTIEGPHCGKINNNYTFTIGILTDPMGDLIYILLDWGDGTTSGWLGPFTSGQIITATHTWSEPGTYNIRLKVKDVYGAESDWSEPFTIYITSKILLIGFVQSAMNQCEECIVLNMSFALIVKLKPIDLKMYSSVQVLILNDELQGVIGSRFIAVLVYGLVLSEESFTIYYHPK